MTRTTSFYLPEDTRTALDERRRGKTRSHVFNRIVDRYIEICRDTPPFSKEEWDFIHRGLRDLEPVPAGVLRAGVTRQLQRFLSGDAGMKETAFSVLRKVDSMSFAQVVALVDDVERYWSE